LKLPAVLISSALAGALQAGAFSPWVAAWGAHAPWLLSAGALLLIVYTWSRLASLRQALLSGLGFGTLWLVGGTGWMFVSLHRYGGLPAWLAALAVLLLCLALAVFMALVAAAWWRWRRGTVWADGVLLGCLWLLAEWARGFVFTGFPWAASGYALIDSPWVGLAPWLGVYGLGAVFVLLLAWAALAVSGAARAPGRASWRLLGATSAVVLLSTLGLHLFAEPLRFSRPQGEAISVTLLQGNIPQSEKFQSEHLAEQLGWHVEALLEARTDLVVAPETAIPVLPYQLPEGYWDALADAFHGNDRAALIGMPLGDYVQGYSNSVVGLSAATSVLPQGYYRYNKHHLVPFGEFIPAGFHWFVNLMNIPLGDFTRGPRNAPSFAVKGQWVAPTICYEDLFGEELAGRFVDGGREAPTVFANVSNLAWFGDRVAIHQHLQIARMRSLEFQRPTIRATNTGATVVIDERGEVAAELAPNTRGALVSTVQGQGGITPFAWWAGRWGVWPLAALAVAGVLLLRRRGGERRASL